MNETFNPEMMVLARESEGLTQTELAKRITELEGATVTQGTVSKIESGVIKASADQIDKIAEALDFPRAFFFQSAPVFGYGSSCYYHRKRQDISVGTMRRALADINILRIQLTQLLRGAEIDANLAFHRMDVAEYESPETIARLLRGAWHLPPGPVQNLIKTIESAGGVVFRCAFGTNKIDAVSQWLPGLPPIFFVNSEIPGDRLRFTLAHELGHLIMHQIPSADIEKEANRFAAEFMMPEKEIGPHLRQLSIQKLASMKPYWKMSMASMLKRSFDLGKISVFMYRKLNTQISKYGFKLIEPLPIASEEPTVLKDLINVHLTEHGYSLSELAQLLMAGEARFRKFYYPNESLNKLRVVK
jgi:Zn-dependent peptidase ImmA (M78 family)/transcriptional regulator with XRE-family HTH domain